MKAIQLSEIHQQVKLVDLPIPKPKKNEALIRIEAAALNHRDVWIQKGLYPRIQLPSVLGSDGTGVVETVGDGVDSYWVGQEVLANPGLEWGDVETHYGKNFQVLGMPQNGTFAEYICMDIRYIHPKPGHLTFAQTAALPLGGLTGYRALFSRAQLKAGEKILITGIGGGVALTMLQMALAVGAEVWVTSGNDDKIKMAKELGAKGGINYRQENWHKSLQSISGGFDVIVDSACGPTFSHLTDLANTGGRIIFFGGTAGNIGNIIPGKVFFKQLSILGTTMGSPADFKSMLNLVNSQEIIPIIDSIFPLEEIQNAMMKMESGVQFGKIIISMK